MNFKEMGGEGDPMSEEAEVPLTPYQRVCAQNVQLRATIERLTRAQLEFRNECHHRVLICSREQPDVAVYNCAYCGAMLSLVEYRTERPPSGK